MQGQKASPKGRHLEVGSQRAHRLLVYNNWIKYSFPRLEWPNTEDPFSRSFVGQNWFRLVLLNRINTVDVIGYFFFTNRALFLCPTYTHPIRSFQGMPNSKEIWIAPMRNPIWPLWTKSCMGHCKLVKTVKSECERQKQAPHSILCAHTVLEH